LITINQRCIFARFSAIKNQIRSPENPMKQIRSAVKGTKDNGFIFCLSFKIDTFAAHYDYCLLITYRSTFYELAINNLRF